MKLTIVLVAFAAVSCGSSQPEPETTPTTAIVETTTTTGYSVEGMTDKEISDTRQNRNEHLHDSVVGLYAGKREYKYGNRCTSLDDLIEQCSLAWETFFHTIYGQPGEFQFDLALEPYERAGWFIVWSADSFPLHVLCESRVLCGEIAGSGSFSPVEPVTFSG